MSKEIDLDVKIYKLSCAMKEVIGIMEEIGVFNHRARDNMLNIIDEAIYDFSEEDKS